MMHAWGSKCRSSNSKSIRLDINTPYNVMAEKGSSINNLIIVKMSAPFFAGFHLCKSGTRRAHNIVGFSEANDIFLDLRCWKLVIPKKLCLTGHTPYNHDNFQLLKSKNRSCTSLTPSTLSALRVANLHRRRPAKKAALIFLRMSLFIVRCCQSVGAGPCTPLPECFLGHVFLVLNVCRWCLLMCR